MTTDIQKLDPDAAIDLAYDIFLEMAGGKDYRPPCIFSLFS